MRYSAVAKEIYEFLLTNCVGENNSISGEELAILFNTSRREVRRALQYINTSTEYTRLVSTARSIYVCETKGECLKSLKDTYAKAISLFRKARAMSKKVALNGQGYTDEDEIKFFESFVREQ